MSAQRAVSNQEAVHMVDNQDLVLCSEKLTYLILHPGDLLTSIKDDKKDGYCQRVSKPQQGPL
jgi:hypothetical protein